MEQGLPLYNGAVKQAARQQFVPMPELPRVQGMGEVLDRAIDAGLEVADKYSKLHDFGEAQKVEHLRRMNDVEMRKGLEKGLTAKWGTRDSFFNEDGTRNEDNIAAFKSRWQEAQMAVPKSFWRRDSDMRDEESVLRITDGLAETVELSTLKQELDNGRRAFEANYALAVEKDDFEGAVGALSGAVDAGWILPAEAQRRKLQLQRKGERARLSGMPAGEALDRILDAFGESELATLGVNVGGDNNEVDVADVAGKGGVAFAAEAPVLGVEEVAKVGGVDGLELPMEDITRDERRVGLLDKGSLHMSLHESMLRDLTETKPNVLSPAELTAELQRAMAGDFAIDAGDFRGGATISGAAPVGAQVAVQQANKDGGWTEDRYKEAVYALGGALVTNPHYKNLSDEAMRALIVKTVSVAGMDEQLFAGELDPKAAYESFVAGHVDNIMSLRDGEIQKRVTEAIAGGRGMPELELPEDDLGAVQYATMHACEVLGRHRMRGGESNWFEEQEVISKGIADGLAEYDAKGGDKAWADFRAEQAKVDLANAKVYEEKAGVWRGKVKAAQDEAAAKVKKEAEAKKMPKKKTKEELLKERPYTGELELRFSYKGNGLQRATLSVPQEEYEKMCEQFECGEHDVLYCDLGGKKTGFLIVPGKDDAWTVNRAAAHVLLGGAKKSELEAKAKSLKAGHVARMKISKKTVVGGNY